MKIINHWESADMAKDKKVIPKTMGKMYIEGELGVLRALEDYCSEYVVSYKDFYKDDENYYLVTNYIPNTMDLFDYINDYASDIYTLLKSGENSVVDDELFSQC